MTCLKIPLHLPTCEEMQHIFCLRTVNSWSCLQFLVFLLRNNAFNTFLEELNESHKDIVVIVLHKKGKKRLVKQASNTFRTKFGLQEHQLICKSAEDANFDAVYKQLKKSIEQIFDAKNNVTSVSRLARDVREKAGMEVDDSRSHYGRKSAERILRDIDDYTKKKMGGAKDKILPLQSNIAKRQEIAALEKELCRQKKCTDDTTVQSYVASVKEKKWRLQLQQLQNHMSETFKYFLQCLIILESEDRKYFLQCLKLGLNERSVQLLEPLYDEYAKCRKKEDSKEKDQQLKALDKQLSHGSLGLEHFFREMAIFV